MRQIPVEVTASRADARCLGPAARAWLMRGMTGQWQLFAVGADPHGGDARAEHSTIAAALRGIVAVLTTMRVSGQGG